MITKIIYIFIIVFIIVIFLKERNELGCENILHNKVCNNQLATSVIGTKPNLDDTDDILLNKIRFASNYTSRFVTWRRNMILTFAIVMGLWCIVFKRLPSTWELVTSMIIIMGCLGFSENFYKFHLADIVDKNILDSTDILRKRL